MPAPNEAPRIYPTFRYRDAARMIDWLVDSFGFTVHAHFKDGEGTVHHAELACGASMIMLGTVADDAYGEMVGGPGRPAANRPTSPSTTPTRSTRAQRRPGVRIDEEPTDRSYGSRDFISATPRAISGRSAPTGRKRASGRRDQLAAATMVDFCASGPSRQR